MDFFRKRLYRTLLVTMLLMQSGCIADGDSTSDLGTLVEVGELAPDFTVDQIDGSPVRLSDLRGRVVLLTFFSSWCPECRDELSTVQESVVNRFSGERFTFLCISRGETRETLEAFRATWGYTFPMGLDPSSSIFGLYASRNVPRNFLLDREGRVVSLTVGYDASEFGALLDQASWLLAE